MFAWVAWQAKRRMGLELEVEDMMEADRLADYGDVEAYFAARIQARRRNIGPKVGRKVEPKAAPWDSGSRCADTRR